jgi:hypothetical protein
VNDWLVLLFNAGGDVITFQLPEAISVEPDSVRLLLATANEKPQPFQAPASSIAVFRVTVSP